MDNAGTVRVWQVDSSELFRSAQTWKRMVGVDQKVLSVIFEKAEDGQENNTEGVTMVNADGQADGGDGSGSGSGEGSGEGDGSGGSGGSGEGGSGGGTNMNEDGREATFVDVSTLELVSQIYSIFYDSQLLFNTHTQSFSISLFIPASARWF
jgi:hypothetical protein